MPFNSLVEEYKVAKARLLLTLRDSSDEKISGAGIEVRTGRKWSVKQAIDQAESSLNLQDIVGTTNKGREGLGIRFKQRWRDSDKVERRSMVQTELRRAEDETRSSRSVQLGSQGSWMKWNLPERQLTWQELWSYEPLQLSFLLRSVYDLLPSPTNLKLWKLSEDPSCPLCGNVGSLRHIMSSCNTALSQGRYRWRHDQVLREMADILEKERKKDRPLKKTGPHFINFVKEGEKKSAKSTGTGILHDSKNWEMLVDLGKKLKFPEEVTHTSLRPDIVMWSRSPKLMVMVELTVPWEERVEESHEIKKGKYPDLADTCKERGWKTWVFPVEVGCRGFPSQSVWKMLGAVGIKGGARNTAAHALGKAAERASSWLWLRRNEPTWQPS
ncbi:uncharacterized protein LOC132745154 [Ruditapes philippinarum]|uniref:uncharacterized protein LOC132745154 n=1 Tax=Ruditapes philippinarum TaxID=129788 RepID=UPI00295C0A78|nr:uncharacterized protein LOC132745154 [Ruditapes philippinarum]